MYVKCFFLRSMGSSSFRCCWSLENRGIHFLSIYTKRPIPFRDNVREKKSRRIRWVSRILVLHHDVSSRTWVLRHYHLEKDIYCSLLHRRSKTYRQNWSIGCRDSQDAARTSIRRHRDHHRLFFLLGTRRGDRISDGDIVVSRWMIHISHRYDGNLCEISGFRVFPSIRAIDIDGLYGDEIGVEKNIAIQLSKDWTTTKQG